MVSSKFSSLSVRPPTPPKDLKEVDSEIGEALQFLDDPFGTNAQPLSTAVAAKASLNTPEQSPSSVIGSSPSSSRKKRVNFELQTCSIPKRDLISQPWTPQHSSPLRPLPQTRVSHPLKSILKPTDPTSTPPPNEPSATVPKFQSFAEMLESVVKMLAQGTRPSRLDAYITIQKTMQAYENIPDLDALRNKMGLFSQFIMRDMQAVGISGTGLDTQLVQQALKFVGALVRIPELRPSMDDDFCSFLLDRSIRACADATIPKAIVNAHLALLMQQNFRPKIMTPARVEKILDALDSVHDRVSGYSVQAYRIRVYRKLIQQRPEVMSKHVERWFKLVLKAMISASRDIHQSALDTALSAAKSIGSERQVIEAVLSLMNRMKSDGASFGKIYAKELDKSLGSDSAVLVPQVWAAITAFLQQSVQDNRFTAAKEWLTLLQKFVSSSDENVRLNGNVAISFFIYAVNVTASTPVNWSKMLIFTCRHQIDSRQTRKCEIDAAASTYFTLLYYAFRANASHEQLSRYWKEYVADFWMSLIHGSPLVRHKIGACRVLSALFTGSGKPWNPYRALELKVHQMIQRQELPRLDPRWVRKSLATILQFVETLLDETPWHAEAADDEPIRTMWISLLDSLVEASSKEVMATAETKDAVAHIVNMLRRLWDRHTSKLAIPQQKEDRWADKFCFLIHAVIQKLGAFQFADKCLTRNTGDEFEVASTPSNRSWQHASRVSPLLYFTDLLITRSEGRLSDAVRLRVMELILKPCFSIQSSRLSKLELLRDCAATVATATPNTVTGEFWVRIGDLSKYCLEEKPSDANERVTRELGKEYEVVVEILAQGSLHLLRTGQGQALLTCLIETVRREAGEGAIVFAIMEKVSGSVLGKVPKEEAHAYMPYATILMENFPNTIVRKTLEQGRQTLYPSSPMPARVQEVDPYHHFYSAIMTIGSTAYNDFAQEKAEVAQQLVAALRTSVERCPVSLHAVYLRKTQDLIVLWVNDAEKKLRGKSQPIKQVRSEILNLWRVVSRAIEQLPKKDNSLLKNLEPLLHAGFTSRRRKIVSLSVATWNATFGEMESLQYPPRLETALKRLRSIVELSLPSLKDEADPQDDAASFDSDSSCEDAEIGHTPHSRRSPYRISKSARKSRSPTKSNRKGSSRQTPKVRLRHDDSQIQFEPIVSSPSARFNQESQVLTERQKEMFERQRTEARIFSDLVPSPSRAGELSPTQADEVQPESPGCDDLPSNISRTPLKSLANMGPLDVYLGSSPTPQARNRGQQILSDDTNIATPNAVRTVQITDSLDEPGSSPPQFKASTAIAVLAKHKNISENQEDPFVPKESSENRPISFDEGSTIDDEIMTNNNLAIGPGEAASSQDEYPTELSLTEVPSSTIEVQVNAQLAADLDARSGSFTSADEEQAAERSTKHGDRSDTQRSDTSRIGDSFTDDPATQEQDEVTPGGKPTRRSLRLSEASSPAQPRVTRKRGRPRKNSTRRTQELKDEEVETSKPQADTITYASASEGKGKRKRRRGSLSQKLIQSQSLVPETSGKQASRKRSRRRSTSLASETEHAGEVLVKDTPAPKRTRRGVSQDVSEAKIPSSQVKHLSHVQVSPRASSLASNENSISVAGAPAELDQVSSVGEQKAKATQQLLGGTASLDEAGGTQLRQASAENGTPGRTLAERVILTPKSIMERLKRTISDLKQMMLGREEERALDDVMFDLRREVHAAGRRGQEEAD